MNTDLSKITAADLMRCEAGPWDHINRQCYCIHCGKVMVTEADIYRQGFKIQRGPKQNAHP